MKCETLIPLGSAPGWQIAPAGDGKLLLGSCCGGTLSRRNNAQVALFSLAEKRKVWTVTIDDLPQGAAIYYPLLATAPEEGWAWIQTGGGFRQIALQDGKMMRELPGGPWALIWAKWLKAKRLLSGLGSPRETCPEGWSSLRFNESIIKLREKNNEEMQSFRRTQRKP